MPVRKILKWFKKSRPENAGAAHYEVALREFELAVIRASTVSYGGVGILTSHARETYCSIIFTKLVVTAHSILKLCPNPNNKDFAESFIDYTAIASLSRVEIDTFIALFHFGLEDCPENEYQVRQLLLFWRDHRVRIKMGMYDDSRDSIDFHEKDLKQRLESNPFWQTIDIKRRKHLLKNNDILHSPYDVMERAGFDPEYNKNLYSYWSAHVHCSSVAFIRMLDGVRGRGAINDTDLDLTIVCLRYLVRILNFSSDKVDEILVGSEQRGKSVKSFNPFNLIHESPPWEGRLKMTDLKDFTDTL